MKRFYTARHPHTPTTKSLSMAAMISFAVPSPCRISVAEEDLGIGAAECAGAESDGNSENY